MKKSHREFLTITGTKGSKRLTVISTGIGTDNIDIVFNELDALVNIDLNTRMEKAHHTTLNFIRIGTSGTFQNTIPIDSIVISAYAVGFDGLMHFYEGNQGREISLEQQVDEALGFSRVYACMANATLGNHFTDLGLQGITCTANGFYGPQGRTLRKKHSQDFIECFQK